MLGLVSVRLAIGFTYHTADVGVVLASRLKYKKSIKLCTVYVVSLDLVEGRDGFRPDWRFS